MATATKSKHTPGPWAVHKHFRDCVVPIADVDKKLGGSIDPEKEALEWAKVIANERGSEYPEFHRSRVMAGEAEANARLIASAPELLQALENSLIFIDYLCEISTLRNKQVRMMAGYHNIESAIKLAKGE